MSSKGINEVKFQVLATFAGNISVLVIFQFFCNFQIRWSGNIIVFGFGCNIGWFSPTLPILVSDDTPLAGGPLDISEVGWIACLPSLGGILGGLIYGFLATKIGYRNSTLQTAVPIIVYNIH